jgi:hypothetical protein
VPLTCIVVKRAEKGRVKMKGRKGPESDDF